jgi:hypothetical protein
LDGTTVINTLTAGMALDYRVQMRLENAVTTPANQIGRYTVLLRAHCTGTLEARVRLRHGLFGSLAANLLQRVVASTNYRLYPLGSIVIPPAYLPPAASVAKTMFMIDSEYVSGSGTLVMDALILIPEERMIHFTTTQQPNEIYTLPDGTVLGVYTVGGLPTGALDIESTNWGAARGDGMMVCVGTTYPNGDHVKGDALAVGMEVYGRWDTLRGAETTVT